MDGGQTMGEDLFHVTHPPPGLLCLFLPLFHVWFFNSSPPSSTTTTTTLLSACLLSFLALQFLPPLSLSVCPLCRLSGQSEVHATECAGLSLGDRTDSSSRGKEREGERP